MVRVLTQPTISSPPSTVPTPMVASVSMQTPIVRSIVECILVMVYKLAIGQFAEVPHLTTRSLNDNTNLLPLEDIPSAPVRQGTLGPMQDQPQRIYSRPGRTCWFPLLQSPHLPSPSKQKNNPKLTPIPHAMVMPKQATWSWGLHCPICKNKEEHKEEDWDGDLQNQPKMHPPKLSKSPAAEYPVPQTTGQSTPWATEPSVPPASVTELPAPWATDHPAIIGNPRQVYWTNKTKKRMGRDNQVIKWKVQARSLFNLRVWLWFWTKTRL